MQRQEIDIKVNGSGVKDPTASKAINKVDKEQERFHAFLNLLFTLCELSGYHIEERIVVKDLKTGRVWR